MDPRRRRPRHCPGCGAPAGAAAGSGIVPCAYCGAPLVPLGAPDPRASVRCPACAAAVAEGASFCPTCGASMAVAVGPPPGTPPWTCPACEGAPPLSGFALAPTRARPAGLAVHGCPRCGGCFVPRATMDALVREAAAAVVPEAVRDRAVPRFEVRVGGRPVRYRHCPACGTIMTRRNFARISGIVVDDCPTCGTFFDARELEDVLAFVRAGGLVAAARRVRPEPAPSPAPVIPGGSENLWDTPAAEASFLAAGVLSAVAFVRFLGRWLADRFEPSGR